MHNNVRAHGLKLLDVEAGMEYFHILFSDYLQE